MHSYFDLKGQAVGNHPWIVGDLDHVEVRSE